MNNDSPAQVVEVVHKSLSNSLGSPVINAVFGSLLTQSDSESLRQRFGFAASPRFVRVDLSLLLSCRFQSASKTLRGRRSIVQRAMSSWEYGCEYCPR